MCYLYVKFQAKFGTKIREFKTFHPLVIGRSCEYVIECIREHLQMKFCMLSIIVTLKWDLFSPPPPAPLPWCHGIHCFHPWYCWFFVCKGQLCTLLFTVEIFHHCAKACSDIFSLNSTHQLKAKQYFADSWISFILRPLADLYLIQYLEFTCSPEINWVFGRQ